MEEIIVCKGPNQTLHPATQEDADKIARYKLGAGVKLRSTKMTEHNYIFHKKLFALFTLCFEYFSELVDTGLEFRGQRVKPSFENFREEMTILAGFYEVSHSLNGSFRVRAKSLSYEKCSDAQKEKIFSALIDTALQHVYQNARSEEWLRMMVDRVLAFDG